MPLFSVVIPAYNRAALLREALDSVFAQTFTDYEVIVVDDGSTDDTAALAAGYAGRVHILHQENRGPGAARNLGLKNASGQYIAFLDSDDLWFPWTLQCHFDALHRSETAAFLAGREVKFDDDAPVPSMGCAPLELAKYSDYLAASKEPVWLNTSSVAVLREAILRIGGFSGLNTNAEDSDLWLKLGEARGFAFIHSPPLYAYRQTPDSLVTDPRRTFAGIQHMIASERAGQYPGGRTRRLERLRIITRHCRPASLGLLQAGHKECAVALYRSSLRWNLRLGRLKYLLGFWLAAARPR